MRTSNGSVVQFLYGEDGMDGTAIEAQKLESLRMSPNKFRVRPCLAPSSRLSAGNASNSCVRYACIFTLGSANLRLHGDELAVRRQQL